MNFFLLWLEYQYKKTEFIFKQIKRRLLVTHLNKKAKEDIVKHVLEYSYECRIDKVLLLFSEYINCIEDIAETEYLLDLLFEKNLIEEEIYHEIIGSCAVRRLKNNNYKELE